MTSNPDLAGHRVLVTGASRGIGKEIAMDLARHGAVVMCSGRHQGTLDEIVDEIASLGGIAYSAVCDLSDPASGAALVHETLERLGGLEVVVNNAGIAADMDDTLDDWLQVMAVNLTAPFVISEAAAQYFKTVHSGKIVNISSILGVVAEPRTATSYVAAKHGLIGMSKNFAARLAPYGIQVNVVAPGYVATQMTKEDFDDEYFSSGIVARVPMGRWGQNEDISGIVTFLASSRSSFITGQTICVDGGWTCV